MRETKPLSIRKIITDLYNDTIILSKIERNERRASIERLPVLAAILDKPEKDIKIQFIQSSIITDLGKLNYLKDGLKEILKTL